jgi:hypothetical protein
MSNFPVRTGESKILQRQPENPGRTKIVRLNLSRPDDEFGLESNRLQKFNFLLQGALQRVDQFLFLLVIHALLGVEDPILERRHLTLLSCLNHFVEFARIVLPIGKVECLPTFEDIIGDQPGTRSDIGVPIPVGFITMALKAMLLYDCACLGTAPGRFGNYRGIGPVMPEWDQLEE